MPIVPDYIHKDTPDNALEFQSWLRSTPEVSHESQSKWIQKRHKERNKKMSPEIVKRWLKALRSGNFKQETHYLKGADNYYSVLGVLLEVTKDITGGEWHGYWFKPKSERFTKGINQDCDDIPRLFLDKLNMKKYLRRKYAGTQDLVLLNTYNGYDFERLADIIEDEYLN